MSILQNISRLLMDKRLRGVEVSGDELLKVHRTILLEKKLLRNVFTEIYEGCMNSRKKHLKARGTELEIGAGTSFFKELHPGLISSDIKEDDALDMVVNAQQMPFKDESLAVVYGINCFHHFPDPDAFFKELIRVLPSGGGCVLIEPYYGWLAGWFYKSLFDTEHFNKKQKDWDNTENQIMDNANQALSYIVFKRDREIFEERYPELEIVEEFPLTNYPGYLLSGGLNFVSLVPAFCSPLITILEWFLYPLRRVFALHHQIVIRKK